MWRKYGFNKWIIWQKRKNNINNNDSSNLIERKIKILFEDTGGNDEIEKMNEDSLSTKKTSAASKNLNIEENTNFSDTKLYYEDWMGLNSKMNEENEIKSNYLDKDQSDQSTIMMGTKQKSSNRVVKKW